MKRLRQLVADAAVAIGRFLVEVSTDLGWAAVYFPEVMLDADSVERNEAPGEIRIPSPRAASDPVGGIARSGETGAGESSS